MQGRLGGGEEQNLAVPGSAATGDLCGFRIGDCVDGGLQTGVGGYTDWPSARKQGTKMRFGSKKDAFRAQCVGAVLRTTTGNAFGRNTGGISEIASKSARERGWIAGVGIFA